MPVSEQGSRHVLVVHSGVSGEQVFSVVQRDMSVEEP